jgi:hypothetical protein
MGDIIVSFFIDWTFVDAGTTFVDGGGGGGGGGNFALLRSASSTVIFFNINDRHDPNSRPESGNCMVNSFLFLLFGFVSMNVIRKFLSS